MQIIQAVSYTHLDVYKRQALILAVALLGSNGIYQLSTQLSAGETESQDTSGEDVSAQNEEESQSVADVPAQDESGAEVTVQELSLIHI